MVEMEHARNLLAEMGLTASSQLLDAQIERSNTGHHTYIQFLDELLTAEKQTRDRRNLEFRIKRAHLPYVRRIEEFDFDFQPSVDLRLIKELSTTAFAHRAENVVLLGPPGVGKTHLAIGLAMKTLDAGMSVCFTTLAHMITDLERATSGGTITRRWSAYRNPSLLIIEKRVSTALLAIFGLPITRGTDAQQFRTGSRAQAVPEADIWRRRSSEGQQRGSAVMQYEGSMNIDIETK